MKPKVVQTCTNCIMDTTDPEITFDVNGVCNHCNHFYNVLSKRWYPNETGDKFLAEMAEKMKQAGRGSDYDCILGLSGGVDSSYLAMKIVEMGLRPLAVHVDAGWNSELAVKNIESICKTLNIDLFTEVIDWEEMRELQVAFLRAGVPNQDIPQDHAFFAALYSYAVKNNIQYVISGSNFATEGILPRSWGHDAMDSKHLLYINNKFGKKKLKKYPTVSFFKRYFYFPRIRKMQVVRPLNFMEYSKEMAIKELEEKVGWRYYGGKHYESRFTKFFQAYWLPERFGFDKRKAHLSSLIVSGLMSREEAAEEMKKPLYDPSQFAEDKEFFMKKLKLTNETFNELFNMPLKSHYEYPTNIKLYEFARKVNRVLLGSRGNQGV